MNNSMQKLISILKKLVTEDINSSTKKDYYINELKNIYTKSFRHMYSELLTFMLVFLILRKLNSYFLGIY